MSSATTIPVILVSGVKNSGKNTFGDFLQAALRKELTYWTGIAPNISMTAFADPIKVIAHDVLGFEHSVLWGTSDQKENTFAYGKSARHWLQWLGTEVFRDGVSPDIWVDATCRAIIEGTEDIGVKGWIITDCRFPNEWTRAVNTLAFGNHKHDYRCFLVKVTRPEAENNGDQHRSETETAKLDAYGPFVIKNDSTLEALQAKANEFVQNILSSF